MKYVGNVQYESAMLWRGHHISCRSVWIDTYVDRSQLVDSKTILKGEHDVGVLSRCHLLYLSFHFCWSTSIFVMFIAFLLLWQTSANAHSDFASIFRHFCGANQIQIFLSFHLRERMELELLKAFPKHYFMYHETLTPQFVW